MTVVEAINDTAKALANLSKVLVAVEEQTKGMSVAQAATVEVEKEPAKKQEAPSKEKQEEQVVTLEQVRAVLAEKSQSGLTDKVKSLLESFGANKLSAVNPEDYADLMAAAKEMQ